MKQIALVLKLRHNLSYTLQLENNINDELDDKIWALFERNGYDFDELLHNINFVYYENFKRSYTRN